jgi:hypothetical protein
VAILVRLQPTLLAKLDAWISTHKISVTRPEAIRRLIEVALAKAKKRLTALDVRSGNFCASTIRRAFGPVR